MEYHFIWSHLSSSAWNECLKNSSEIRSNWIHSTTPHTSNGIELQLRHKWQRESNMFTEWSKFIFMRIVYVCFAFFILYNKWLSIQMQPFIPNVIIKNLKLFYSSSICFHTLWFYYNLAAPFIHCILFAYPYVRWVSYRMIAFDFCMEHICMNRKKKENSETGCYCSPSMSFPCFTLFILFFFLFDSIFG